MAAFGVWEEKNINVLGNRTIEYTADYSKCQTGGKKKSKKLKTISFVIILDYQ